MAEDDRPHGNETGPPKVLVCLDGSPLGEAGLAYAIALARSRGAIVVLLQVIEAPGAQRRPIEALGAQIARADAFEYLDAVARRVRAEGVDAQVRIDEGQAAERVLHVAQSEKVELVALSTHGAHGATQFRLGGTAQRIVDHARCSILLVPCRGSDGVRSRIERILVLLDGSPAAESALGPAVRLARRERAEIVLLNVVPRPTLGSAEPLSQRDQALLDAFGERNVELARGYLRGARQTCACEGIACRCSVETAADVRQGVVDAIEREDVDLVVVGSHGRTANPAVAHGGLVHHLLGYSPRPVWVIQCLRARTESGRLAVVSRREIDDLRSAPL